MIQERFMVTAKGAAANKGKTFNGYLYKQSLENPRAFMYSFENINCPDVVEIDYETVESMPVPVNILNKGADCYRVECPNCKSTWIISNNVKTPAEYCKHCGQRLDWDLQNES